MDIKDQAFALKLARDAVNLWVERGERYILKECPDRFKENRGVFVSLHTWPEGRLRGCIGYPDPVYPLGLGIIKAAVQACSDSRFEFLNADELDKTIIELSVLTRPKLIEVTRPEDYKNEIVTGKDGLIVRRGVFSGLLLPQVARAQGWNASEFLTETCLKAGLASAAWMDPKVQVYRFQAQVFSEERPGKGLKIE